MNVRTRRLPALRHRMIAAAGVGGLILAGLVVSAPTATAAVGACTVTAGVTTCVWDEPGGRTWVVPPGVTEATLEVAGAQGGGAAGGNGGQVTATLATVPGTGYWVGVGQRGETGSATGGGAGGFGLGAPGGGAQPIPGSLTDPAAAGAGGGGRSTISACSNQIQCPPILVGGGGGGEAGRLVPSGPANGAGGGGGSPAAPGTGGGAGGGGGGGATATAPGAGGIATDTAPPSPCVQAANDGNAGDLVTTAFTGFGGFGGFGCIGGGGGGGGFHGGGGGSAGFTSAGGGGGGSNHAAANFSATQHVTGARAGNGRVRISYSLPDTTAPATTITRSPAVPNGSDGWYTTAVGVTIASTDAGSGVAQTRCVLDPSATPTAFADLPTTNCAITSVGTDGDHTLYAASIDNAGNVSPLVSSSFRIDRTAPALSPVVSPASVPLNGTASADPGASDAGSGLADSSCDAVVTSTVGPRTLTCRATDVAGNTTTVEVAYTVVGGTVGNTVDGFFRPVEVGAINVAKAGQAIPLTWRVTDADGAPVSDLEAAGVSVSSLACQLSDTNDLPAESAAGGSGFQNLGDGYYQFNWKTPKSYAGSCKTLRVDIGDGLFRTAQFHFTR